MSLLILILYIICEVLLCLQSFKLYKDWTRLKAEDVATGMTMLLQTLQHLFFYFYASQNLMSQTQDLHTSIYCSEWYKADCKYQRSLTIVLSRSVRPVILTAGKVLPVTFRSFLKVTSY
ncbi:odorant receptor 22b-like [Nilaparvata lugens]|uniref:odorant receptor 22b-like n=1 Tax=Nilaparvata lugens TaxID=108931 RepID=UPI00193D1D10|nr:odorant receptor 22b-like [Nilaparvata lugens]